MSWKVYTLVLLYCITHTQSEDKDSNVSANRQIKPKIQTENKTKACEQIKIHNKYYLYSLINLLYNTCNYDDSWLTTD